MTMEVSAEVHFAQTLASNDKKFRDRALKRLKKYISVRSSNGEGLSHDDFLKLWKGLHYCMWMQDKPLIQEELSQKMVSLLHAFPKLQDVLRFVHVFFITEAREWTGIDRLRLDKFMLLIREMLHETFELLSRNGWPVSECQNFAQNLTAVIMNEDSVKIPYGIKMHLADIYLVEMRKVSFDGMDAKKFTFLMFPFIYFLLKTKRRDLAQTVRERTLDIVLREFGTWSWVEGRNKNTRNNLKSKKIEDERGDASEEEENLSDDSEEEEEDASECDEDDASEGDEDDASEGDEDEASEGDEDEASEGDEDEDGVEMEEDSEGESDMVVDNEPVKPKRKYDLSSLLRLMHKLAKDPKVEIRNRRYVYGMVSDYVSKDPTILQSPQNDNKDLDIVHVYQLTGETMKEDFDNKKRRRRNRKRRLEEEKEAGEVDMDSQESVGNVAVETKHLGKAKGGVTTAGQLDEDEEKKKKNKKNRGNEQQENAENSHLQTPSEPVLVNKSKKKKGMHEPENLLSKDATAKNVGKKRKRMSSDGEGSMSNEVQFKKSKMSVKSDNVTDSEGILDGQSPIGGKVKPKSPPVTTPKTSRKQESNKASSEEERGDANTNARSPSGSAKDKGKGKKNLSFISPVECVVYKQKSPTAKPSTINKLATSMTLPLSATTKFSVSESSPSRSRRNIDPNALSATATVPPPESSVISGESGDDTHVTVPERAKTGSTGKVGARSGSPDGAAGNTPSPRSKQASPKSSLTKKGKSSGSDSSDSSMMGSLYNMISTPCNMIKKAVGMMAPATDPGVSREKTVTLPEQLTPGAQKKVVFDLRRNKANKFQDYLKTLASEPSSPAFEPSKSPGHSILKSPSTESVPSSAGSTPTTKRKKRKRLE